MSSTKKTDFVWGYTVGIGAAHLVTGNWSLKLESLYFNLNSKRFSGTTDRRLKLPAASSALVLIITFESTHKET